MEQVTNASFTMADEIIRSINNSRIRMLLIYQSVLALDVDAIKPLVDEAIIIWVQIYNKVKIVDEEFYNKLKTIKDECVEIARSDVYRKSQKEQYQALDKLTEFIEMLQDAYRIIGIDIKVRVK